MSYVCIVYAGVTLMDVIPLALKRDKWMAVRKKLKIYHPEEKLLMEMMSQSDATTMVASLISNRLRNDREAVLELFQESVNPREQGMYMYYSKRFAHFACFNYSPHGISRYARFTSNAVVNYL